MMLAQNPIKLTSYISLFLYEQIFQAPYIIKIKKLNHIVVYSRLQSYLNMSKAPPTRERSEYMQWVTDNVDTFVQGQNNVVACVYCKRIYETKYVKTQYNCLWCNCGIDALMVVKHSPLNGLTEPEQRALLDKWHAQGFTSIPRG
jgi:hypothetical protein